MLLDDAWLAGFAAGEGCFIINPKVERGTANPTFRILLRADDAEILGALQREFGGNLSFDKRLPDAHGGSQSGVVWYVTAQKDLARLVTYFDRFPIRNKKQRDYLIWRRAVKLYCAHGARACADEMWQLKAALEEGRRFAAEVTELSERPITQLRLAEGA